MGNVRYALKGQEKESKGPRLLYVSMSVYEGDWPSISHTHSFSELFYVRQGQGEFSAEGESFPVRQDDLVIVNPGIPHTERSVGSKPLEYVVLGVEGLRFSFGGEKNDYRLANYRGQREELAFYFGSMLRETENRGRDYELVCQRLLEVLMILLLRGADYSFAVAPPQQASRECSLVKRHIDANFSEVITLASLAELSHLNKFYLALDFKSCYGLSPIDYLIQRRLQTSKELLISTDYSISQVAQMSGFSSQSYFSQAFRRLCSMAPGEYRRLERLPKGQ